MNKRKIELKDRIVITGSLLTYPQAIDWVIRNKRYIKLHAIAKDIGCNPCNFTRYIGTRLPDRYHKALIESVENILKNNC